MMFSFIKGKKLSLKINCPLLLNYERTVINHIILESRVKFN